MVKGITRQVVVVQGGAPAPFEQAIFLVRDKALQDEALTDEALLKQAKLACRQPPAAFSLQQRLLWSLAGAGLIGGLWLLSALLF